MHDFYPELTPSVRAESEIRVDDKALRANQRVLDRYVSYCAYNEPIGARAFEPDPAFAPVPVIGCFNPGGPYWSLPDGSTSAIRYGVRRHQEWRNGILNAVVHYTSATTGGNFTASARIDLYREADSLAAVGFVNGATFQVIPQPAAANAKLTYVPVLNVPIDGRTTWVVLSFARFGGDAADGAGTLLFVGAELVYIEATRSA